MRKKKWKVKKYKKPRGTLEFYVDARGMHRWRLIASNGNIIAVSGEGYSSMSKACNGFSSVCRYIRLPGCFKVVGLPGRKAVTFMVFTYKYSGKNG